MTLRLLPLEALGFAFEWPSSAPAGTVSIWLNSERLHSEVLLMPMFPLPEGKGVAFLPVRSEAFGNRRRLHNSIRAFVAQDPLLAEVVGERSYAHGMQRIPLGWGRTPRFGVPGALLMGDAAHPVTPAGGQGANAAVADALVLAEVALERPPQLLSEYAQRRYPATQRSLSLSRGAARIFTLPPPVRQLGIAVLPWAARWLNKRPETFGRLLRTAANAFRERP
jgi:2-polyprenyl-6-methoxyphenol hydroxylase-like FAD-dependent oxidoreductase